MSELLPAFEDEPVVNDLIHLPASPGDSRDKNNDKKQSPASIDSAERNLLKEMELPLSDVSVIKQDITSLLSDLRKLVKPESNPEAKKLLDNLENILNSNYKNNTELLVTCFNTSSHESRSSQKTPSNSIEKFDKSSIDKSEKESGKISSQEKICNNEKSLSDIKCKKLEDILQDRSQDVVSIEKSSVTSSSCKYSESTSITDSSELTEDSKHKEHKAKERDNQVDKKIAIELLINLKKLLSGQSKDDTTIQLLKNIGKVLNTALNSSPESEMQANCTRKQNIQQTTPVRARKSDYNAHSSTLTAKVAHRRSLEPKSKVSKIFIIFYDNFNYFLMHCCIFYRSRRRLEEVYPQSSHHLRVRKYADVGIHPNWRTARNVFQATPDLLTIYQIKNLRFQKRAPQERVNFVCVCVCSDIVIK